MTATRETLGRRAKRLAGALVGPLGAAGLLAATELALVVATARGSFLNGGEQLQYVVASAAGLVLVSIVGWAIGSAIARAAGATGILRRPALVRASRRAALVSAAVALPLAAWAAWSLTSGRRLRDLAARPLLVAAVALAAALATGALAALLVRAYRTPNDRTRWLAATGLASLAVAAMMLDAAMLARTYPAFHWALAATAVAAALAASALARLRAPRRERLALAIVATSVGLVVASPFALAAVRSAPNARYVVEESAPLTGKLVRALRMATPARETIARGARRSQRSSRALAPSQEGIDLRERSVLLVTIDALRADRLAALGGGGLTPRIDALAAEGAVFTRAYTPTPHTSYALASVLTGKFLRPVLEMPSAPAEHPTIPDLLRRHGYRTAAFYPPAIFFVDEQRFGALRDAGFGFEYRKEMFAPASERVAQLEAYFEELEVDNPVFAWVHLFEPHEPYELHPGLSRGDSALERYDAEVAVADLAVGRLVEVFRRERPGATVIVTADHGEEFGDHGGHYHGTTLYEEQVRVPLVWSSPGAVPHAIVGAPVEIVDIAPTLLAAVGIPRDARMRGDDLGPLLGGAADAAPVHAFAGISEERMVTDGRFKAICAAGETTCRLYDLARDPRERQNLALERPDVVARLRDALGEHIASIPRVELGAIAEAQRWPEALTRADLGDPTAGPDCVPLLGDGRAEVRAAAARALGELSFAAAGPVLGRLRTGDDDARVRAEAAIAALRLGDDEARQEVRDVVTTRRGATELDDIDVARRAALVLAASADPTGEAELVALAADASAGVDLRARAIDALATLRARSAVPVLVALLEDMQLRTPAATALGRIGDRRAARHLAAALEREPYIPARTAEARALALLRYPRTAALVRQHLGDRSPLPDGVAILIEVGALARPSGGGALVARAARAREGIWTCDDEGCTPGEGAAIRLPAAGAVRGDARAIVRVIAASDDAVLRVGDRVRPLRAGAQEVAFDLPAQTGERTLPIYGTGDVRIVAIVIVPRAAVTPDPPGEPG